MSLSEQRYKQCLLSLRKYWGYDSFRPGQDQAIRSVCEGQKTLVIFPTAAGKSFCYQVPAVSFEGLCLVISPLVALMEDQVKQLQDRGISAAYITSKLGFKEIEQRLVNARNGMYDLLYLSPERLANVRFKKELEQLPLSMIAIDEAHCISEWGHEFRPIYRQLAEHLSVKTGHVQWLALTATATPEVQKDICHVLGFHDHTTISLPFKRENLIWWVIRTEHTIERMISTLEKVKDRGDGLIYASTRKNSERWAERLMRHGIQVQAYHAGLSADKRTSIQQQWISGNLPWVTATNAFGMGIDKPNCRYVFHETTPNSLEAYYQEAGRAGRDGQISYPILFYNPAHLQKAKERIEVVYPPIKELTKQYQVLCDALGLALGAEMLDQVAVSVDALCRRSGWNAKRWASILESFERWGLLELRKSRSRILLVQFLYSPKVMRDIIDGIKDLDKQLFMDRFLRCFGLKAYHQELRLEWDETKELFNDLSSLSFDKFEEYLEILAHEDQWIHYRIQESVYKIRLLEARQASIPLDEGSFFNRKKNALEKIEWMHLYAESMICREVFIRQYFGETKAEDCGHCDNCERTQISRKQVMTMEDVQELYDLLGAKLSLNYLEIRRELPWSKEQVDSALHWLLSQQLIEEVFEEFLSYRVMS
tara:strand:+ start:15359 stop:17314 length:1956 start_codon:yes stop_codon:yes gene_type:complete